MCSLSVYFCFYLHFTVCALIYVMISRQIPDKRQSLIRFNVLNNMVKRLIERLKEKLLLGLMLRLLTC